MTRTPSNGALQKREAAKMAREKAEATRWLVERFIVYAKAKPPRPIDPDLSEAVADLLQERIDRVAPLPKGKPSTPIEAKFAAWFAVECDPSFNTLPRSQVGVYAEVGELLGLPPRTVEEHVKACEDHRRGRGRGRHNLNMIGAMLVHAGHLDAYAQAKGMELPQDEAVLLEWLSQRLDPTGPGARRAYLRKKKRSPK